MNKLIVFLSVLFTWQWAMAGDYSPKTVRPALDAEQKAAFMHFWNYTDKEIGMIHAGENVNNKNFTTGGSGFGIMVTLVGVERGWAEREQAAKRILTLINFLEHADRIQGAWSHWMDREGKPVKFGKQIEAGDLVETSFVMMGLYAAEVYFDGQNEQEKEIRAAVERLRNSVDWKAFVKDDQLYWLWERTTGAYQLPLKGYNEALITYILALGAPKENAITEQIYRQGWTASGAMYRKGRTNYGYNMMLGADLGGPMFLSHYSFLGINPRQTEDRSVNYFSHGMNHAMINRHYCLEVAPKEHAYNEENWGLTACSGPIRPTKKGYKARSPKRDDGVIAPTAALASMPYVPLYATQVLMNLHANHPKLQTNGGGFGDAYSLIDNWYSKGCIAIDQAPIVIMIENYRSGFIWNLLANHPNIKWGLERAGIGAPVPHTGFPYAVTDVRTGNYDAMMHPDRERYEIDFALEAPARVQFTLTSEKGKRRDIGAARNYEKGFHVLSFGSREVASPGVYTLTLSIKGQPEQTLKVHLW